MASFFIWFPIQNLLGENQNFVILHLNYASLYFEIESLLFTFVQYFYFSFSQHRNEGCMVIHNLKGTINTWQLNQVNLVAGKYY